MAHEFFRALRIWIWVVPICAAPSFWIAAGEYPQLPMILGVIFMIIAYSAAHAFLSRRTTLATRPNLRRALRCGFIFRMVMALTFLLAIGLNGVWPSFSKAVVSEFIWFEIISGMIAINITGLADPQVGSTVPIGPPSQPEPFLVFLTTIVDALLQSLVVLLFSLVLWAILSLLARKQ